MKLRPVVCFLLLSASALALSSCKQSESPLPPSSGAPRTSALITAAERGDLDEIKELLEKGTPVDEPDARGLTPYQAALIQGYPEVAAYLASQGADASRLMPAPEKLAEHYLQQRIKPDGPGAAVLVARNGKVLFQQGYGLANLEKKEPITGETKFRIGSITKQFTAAAILRLQEMGKLSVQDRLSKYLPEFPRSDEVTLHHLLTHSSGIHSYTSKPEFLKRVTESVTSEDLIKWIKEDPYDFSPGEQFLYNNSGYFLLGHLVEKISGQSFEDFLQAHFFVPLEMTSTGVHRKGTPLPHEAMGHSYISNRFRKALDWDMSWAGGAGALYSTVGDLHRWNEGVFQGEVLQKATLESAWQPVQLNNKAASDLALALLGGGYGYGWSFPNYRGLKLISHGGGLNGFLSYLARVPDHDFTVVVLANAAPPASVVPEVVARDLIAIYLWQEMETKKAHQVLTSADPKTYDELTGRYDVLSAILTITREGDRLWSQLTGQPKFELFPESTNRFFLKVVDAQLEFNWNAAGKIESVTLFQNGQSITASRIEAPEAVKLSQAQLDRVTGQYSFGPGAVMTIRRQGEQLFAQMTGQPEFEIFPKSETEFFWKVINARIRFVEDQAGKVTGAVHSQAGQELKVSKI